MNFEIKEGISILNTRTKEIGVAEEYVYTTMFAVRYDKCPDCVCVKVDNRREFWHLKDCEPC